MLTEKSLPWFEDAEFWNSYAPLMFNKQRWAMSEEEVEELIPLLNLKNGASILDTCCGVGRHSIALALRGFNVTGVDRTGSYIEAAQISADAEGASIRFVLQDMRDFHEKNSFDAALNMFTSFGYFESEEEEMAFLGNVYASLKSGGSFVLDLLGKEVLARDFIASEWFEEDGLFILQEHRIIKNWGRLENRWVLLRDGKIFDYTFSHSIYSGAEISRLLKKAGFKEVALFGSLEGTPYDENAGRLIAVGYKG